MSRGKDLLRIEKNSTLKTLAIFTGLTGVGLILVWLLVPEEQKNDVLAWIMVVYSLLVLVVPKVLHLVLCQKLEASLFERLGEIWGEGKGPRSMDLIRAKTEYTDELDSIEQRYGAQLTEDERSLLSASRRQYEIGRKWPLPVCLIWALSILLGIN